MTARELSVDELEEIRTYARRHLVFLEWNYVKIPIGDPLVMGSYAARLVAAIYWYGDLVYRRIE